MTNGRVAPESAEATGSGPKDELVESAAKGRPSALKLAPWKLALIGTAAVVVVVGAGVGLGVGLSGSGESDESGDTNRIATTPVGDTGRTANTPSLNTTNNNGTTEDPSGGNSTDIATTTNNTTAATTISIGDNATTSQSNDSSQATTKQTIAMTTTTKTATPTTKDTETNATTGGVDVTDKTTTAAKTTTVATTTVTTIPPTTTAATTTPAPTLAPPTPEATPASDLRRTVIFLKFQSSPGENLFLRGGISNAIRTCPGTAALADNPCALPIQYYTTPYEGVNHFNDYRTWSEGDNYLDFDGAEPGQGTVGGTAAKGSPTAWTQNNAGAGETYVELNKYGMHYWMIDLTIDCAKTEMGWFDVTGFVADGGDGSAEGSITQAASCGGSFGGNTRYQQGNHLAYCGKVNAFVFNDGSCVIDNFPR